MQPHPEFVEAERHGHAVNDRADIALRVVELGEEQQPRHRREQKNPVVQMMNVRSARVQKQIGDAPRHDQNHERARRDESEEERRERQPC